MINEIESMECLDTDKLKEIVYRLDLFDSEYTFELKEQIIDRVKVIEFNNFGALLYNNLKHIYFFIRNQLKP